MDRDMFSVFYSFFTDYIKVWLVLWGIMNIPFIKSRKMIYTVYITQTIVVLILSLSIHRFPEGVMFYRILLVIFTVGLVLQGKFFKKLAYSLLAYVLILFLDSCIVGISSLYANMSGSEILTGYIYNLFLNATNIFTIGLFVLVKNRKKKYKTVLNVSKRVYALLFAGAATGLITLAGLLIRSNDSTTEAARKLMVIVTIVVVIAYNAVCLMIMIITESRDNYKSLSLINQNIIESQQQYYTLVHEKQQEMHSIRHEMKNHLACIHALCQADKLGDMKQYIKQLIEASSITDSLLDSGNDIVNAILNDAQSRHGKRNIKIRLQGGFPEELHLLPMDLCVIFANLISNAAEAILRMERAADDISCIEVRITSYKDDLFIEVKNPVDKTVQINNGRFVTSKSDKDYHGFGVKNITQRVEKYKGTAKFKSENNQFFVEIHMKNKS